MAQTYQGKWFPENVSKYKGNPGQIKFRSLWERQVFRWLDANPGVIEWSSEEIIIPYRCKTDGKLHRYFVDLYVKFQNSKTYLIEIKPKSQVLEPKPRARKTPKYIREVMTYAKNISKWNAASEFAADRGWEFKVWTEDTLQKLGIKLLT